MTISINGTNGLIQAYDYQVLTTGFSYTFAAGTQVLVINPAGTLATGTITMPAAPSDGMTITFSSTKIITALTVNANSGQTINNNVTTLSAGQSAAYIYRAASTAWFPFTDVAAVAGYAGVNSTRFTSTGAGQTFTIPAGVTQVKATIVAGGGNGAGGTGSPFYYAGGGGGGAAIKWLTGLTPGNTLTVTVGAAAGASSIASGTQTITTVSATAGSNGSGTTPGGGGIGSSGDLNIKGSGAIGTASSGGVGGAGGASILGGGAAGTVAAAAAANAGGVYGGGGGGPNNEDGGTRSGGAGAQGVVIFEY